MTIWRLDNEDISMAAGGPMGSPTKVRWSRLHKSLNGAKDYVDRYIKKNGGDPVHWMRSESGNWTTDDTGGDTQYTITRERVYA